MRHLTFGIRAPTRIRSVTHGRTGPPRALSLSSRMVWALVLDYVGSELLELCVMRNVFEAILECGHDEDFVPFCGDDFRSTDAPAGSRAKLEVLAERVRRGEPLWHPEDRGDYSGLTGAVRPRD